MTDFKNMNPDELRSIFTDDSYKNLFDDDDYMVLASRIAETGDSGITYLTDILGTCDETRSKAVLFAVSRSPKKQHQIVKLLGTCLDDRRPLVVSEAIDGLIRLNDRTCHEKIMSCLTCGSGYVRGAVLRYISRTADNRESFGILIASLNDPHYIVRENAADELAETGRKEAVPYLLKLLEDPHPDVRLAVQSAVDELSDDEESGSIPGPPRIFHPEGKEA